MSRDLGEHRLKDFDEPVSIFQLGDGRFPPLKTISNTNLPRPASSFVGREREVAEVGRAARDGARLVTLTGPGGSGKTRLAIEAAAELVGEFRQRRLLGRAGDASAIRRSSLPTIAQTLGRAGRARRRTSASGSCCSLLDNLEQVVDAAPELAALVEACPNLRLLVTTRELLRVRGEVEYEVLPLADAGGGRAVLPARAARAERRRSRSCAAGSTTCRSRSSSPPPGRRRSRPSRSSSGSRSGSTCSRAAATPTRASRRCGRRSSGRYDLLSPDEQQLFARLAVFAGGCTLEAAEEVCDADLDTLQSLVEKSLLRHTGERFWMLETIREYAARAASPMPGGRCDSASPCRLLCGFRTEPPLACAGRRRHGDSGTRCRDRQPPCSTRVGRWDGSTAPNICSHVVAALWFIWAGAEISEKASTGRGGSSPKRTAYPPRTGSRAWTMQASCSNSITRPRPTHQGTVIALFRDLGEEDPRFPAILRDLAQIEAELGNLPKARSLADEPSSSDASRARRRGSHTPSMDAPMWSFAPATSTEQPSSTKRHSPSTTLSEVPGNELMIGECARRTGNLNEAGIRLSRPTGPVMEQGWSAPYQRCYKKLGALLLLQGRAIEAATVFGAAEPSLPN